MDDERRRSGRPNGAARDEAYAAIRHCVKKRLAEFYQSNPEWMDDERSQRGVDTLLTMLRCILLELDKYEIGKPAATPEPPVSMGCGLGVLVCQLWDVARIVFRRGQ